MKISVAYIRSPRGFRGELAAVLYRASSQSLKPGLEVTIRKGERSRDLKVEYVKQLRKWIGIKLAGIDDEEAAESWRGAEILVERENLEPLNQAEFYHFDLEGAEVYEENGELIGIVENVDSGAGNDLLTVKSEKGEILIPFVKEIVKSVDVEGKKIVIAKIEGLY